MPLLDNFWNEEPEAVEPDGRPCLRVRLREIKNCSKSHHHYGRVTSIDYLIRDWQDDGCVLRATIAHLDGTHRRERIQNPVLEWDLSVINPTLTGMSKGCQRWSFGI